MHHYIKAVCLSAFLTALTACGERPSAEDVLEETRDRDVVLEPVD